MRFSALLGIIAIQMTSVEAGDTPEPGGLRETWLPTHTQLKRILSSGSNPQALSNPGFFMQLAMASYHVGELEDAIHALKQATVLNPNGGTEYLGMLCDLYYHSSKKNPVYLAETADCAQQQLLSTPKLFEDAKFWGGYGTVLRDLGRYDLAVRAQNFVMKLEPDDHSHYGIMAMILVKARRMQEVIDLLEEHIEEWEIPYRDEKWFADAVHDLGRAFLSFGLMDKGFHYVKLSIRLKPDVDYPNADNYYQSLARAYLQIGRLDLARATLWGIAKYGNGHRPINLARRGFEMLQSSYEARGQTAQATLVARELLSLTPPDHPYVYFLTASLSTLLEASLNEADYCSNGVMNWHWLSPQCYSIELALTAAPGDPNWLSIIAPPIIDTDAIPAATPPIFEESRKLTDGARELEDEKGVIVYLCCGSEQEVRDLEISLSLVVQFMPSSQRYPIVVLHDYLTSEMKENIVTLVDEASYMTTKRPFDGLHFLWLEEEDWHGDIPRNLSRQDKIYGYGMGYRHMCRLFSGPPLAKIKSLTGFDWFMRIDTDSFLLGPVEVDLFSHAAANNVKYGWLGAYMDQEYFVTGLWETTRQWMKTEGLSEKELNQWIEPHLKMQKKMKEDDAPAVTSRGPSQTEEAAESDELAVAAAFTDGDYDDVRFCFATNFFLIKTDWMTSPLFARYHKWLDDAEGFYRYRWGDACVHFLAVASMLDRQEETYRYNHDVPYWHQGTVLMPEYPGYFSNSNF